MADPRYPIRCAAAPAGTGMEGSVGLPCAAVRRLSAGRAWRRRHPETDFAQLSIVPPKGDSHPASAQRLQRDGAGGVNGSISLSSSPRAARQRPIWSHGTAPLTPRLGAPRPPSREAYARAQVGRSSCYCTGPASARRTAYRPPTGAIEVLGRLPAPSAPPSRGCGCMLPHRTCSASLCRQFAAAFGIDLDLKWP